MMSLKILLTLQTSNMFLIICVKVKDSFPSVFLSQYMYPDINLNVKTVLKGYLVYVNFLHGRDVET